jgi:SOS-response transcriptional repressor LexA
MNLTNRQKEILGFIKVFHKKWGLNPTVADLVKAGFGSRQNVRYHLWALKEKGRIEFVYIEERMRGVKLV